MKNNSFYRFAGICSIFVGISYIFVGGSYLLLPVDQKAGTLLRDPGKFLVSLSENATFLMVQYVGFILGALLALAVVVAASDYMRRFNEGWVRWTGHLAYLGFVAVAIDHLRAIVYEPLRAAQFVAGDSTIKTAIAVNNSLVSIDPHMWLECGGVGLWILTLSVVSLRHKVFPSLLAWTGIAGAILYWFVVIGTLLRTESLIFASALGAFIIGPIWYIWLGRRLMLA